MKQIQSVKSFCPALLLVLTFTVCGCSPKVDNRGYVAPATLKEQIRPGETTREEVLSRLGSPSVQSSFGSETWYYITTRKEAYAFLKSEVVDQDTVRIEFDSAGVVSKVEVFDESSTQDVDFVKRKTPTEGHALGFFEQLLGNIGRFNRPSNDTAAPGRRPGGY